MMNKAQILKSTGLSEEEFYRLYPTEESYIMANGGQYGGSVMLNDEEITNTTRNVLSKYITGGKYGYKKCGGKLEEGGSTNDLNPGNFIEDRKKQFLSYLGNTSSRAIEKDMQKQANLHQMPDGSFMSEAEMEEGLTEMGYAKKGGKWIPKNLKKGRCTPAPNADCPVGSPQYNLAMTFKKHNGFHKQMGGTPSLGMGDLSNLKNKAIGGSIDATGVYLPYVDPYNQALDLSPEDIAAIQEKSDFANFTHKSTLGISEPTQSKEDIQRSLLEDGHLIMPIDKRVHMRQGYSLPRTFEQYQEGGQNSNSQDTFEPHMMYDQEGNEYWASTYEEHLQMKEMGYLHEDEMKYGGVSKLGKYLSNYQSGGEPEDCSDQDKQNPFSPCYDPNVRFANTGIPIAESNSNGNTYMGSNADLNERNRLLHGYHKDLIKGQSDKATVEQANINKRETVANQNDINTPETYTQTVNGEDQALAGILAMEGLTYLFNADERKNRRDHMRGMTNADRVFSSIPASAGSRGDYSVNEGYFRPDDQVPVQFPGASGFAKYGGKKWQDGGEYYLSDQEIEDLKNQGYDVEYLD